MFIHNLNPALFSIGSLEVRWYGIVYVVGFLLSIWWLQYLSKKGKLELSTDEIWDLGFYIMVGMLLGARLFMIFWQPDIFLYKPWNLLKIWEGGMSFHGAFVGIVVAGWMYCRRNGKNFWKIADAVSVPGIFVLAVGRIANFINGELWGRVWNGSWCVNFKNTGGGDVCRHPSQLYAGVKRFIVFGWVLWLSVWKEFKPGFIFWNFVFWEGLGRVIVDFWREDPLFVYLSLGQWFSLIMVVVSLVIFAKYYKGEWKSLLSRE